MIRLPGSMPITRWSGPSEASRSFRLNRAMPTVMVPAFHSPKDSLHVARSRDHQAPRLARPHPRGGARGRRSVPRTEQHPGLDRAVERGRCDWRCAAQRGRRHGHGDACRCRHRWRLRRQGAVQRTGADGRLLRRAERRRVMLTDLTIVQARDGLRTKQFSAVDLTMAHLHAIEALNPRLNAFITVSHSQPVDQAREADAALAAGQARALTGIPLAIKDLFCTQGVRTTAGSKILGPFVPPYESTVTANLLRDGAVFLGKANLDKFARVSSHRTP